MEWASLQWWCVLGVCLVATAAASSPSPSGQEECEVLNNIESSFPLPTTITVKPKAFVWALEFVLQGENSRLSLCVRVENNYTTYTTALHLVNCRTGPIMDVAFVTHSSTLYSPVQPHVWTTLDVEAESKAVLVTAPNRPITLRTIADESLPVTLRVMMMKNVEAAVGCYDICPFYKYSAESSEKIYTTQGESVFFYFQVGPTFQKLVHEMTCTRSIGTETMQLITEINNSTVSQGKWYMIALENTGDVTQTLLDFTFLGTKDMPSQCTFKAHSLLAKGEVRLSFCGLYQAVGKPVRSVAHCVGKSYYMEVLLFLVLVWLWW